MQVAVYTAVLYFLNLCNRIVRYVASRADILLSNIYKTVIKKLTAFHRDTSLETAFLSKKQT